jgi:hypothetical protein
VQMQFRAPELVILSGILSAACSQRKDIWHMEHGVLGDFMGQVEWKHQ